MILLRFSSGSGPAAAILRFLTWSSFSHVGFKLENGFVLDATPEHGVSIRHAVDDETTQYFEVTGAQKQVRHAVTLAHKELGKPYDWESIRGMFVRRDWHKDDKWECSELLEAKMSQAGYPLIRDNLKFNRITPRDLLLSPRIRQVIRKYDWEES